MSLSDSPATIQIRFATADEAEAIASVLHQAFVEYEALYTPEGFAATTPTAEQIRARWSEGPVWVAVHEDTMVGTVSAVPKRESLYIRSMAILPSARGRKIGTVLLEQVERFAVAHGYPVYCSARPLF
jgi:GNAT superfamily N-acetyltransferase